MHKTRYHRMYNAMHADEALIEKTLSALAAQSRPAKSRFPAVLLTAGVVACLLAVILTLNPPPDLITAASATPAVAEGFTPLSNQADEQVTLSVGTVTMDSKGIITIPITITGACIRDQVRLSYGVRAPLLITDVVSYISYTEAQEGKAEILTQFQLQEGMTLDDLGGALEVTVYDILVARDASLMLHDSLLLSSLPRSVMENRNVITSIRWREVAENATPSPEQIHREELRCLVPSDLYIDLGNGYAVTALGFNGENELVLQLRLPTSLPQLSTVTAQLVRTNGKQITSWLSFEHQGWWDEDVNYCYHEFTTPEVHPDNLDDYTLLTRTESITAWLDDGWQLSIPSDEIQIIE